MEEREVKVRDLFWFIISHWRTLIIILVIGALLGGAYSYYKSGHIVVNPDLQIDQIMEKDDVKYKDLLEAVDALSAEEGAYSLSSVLTESDINSINMYYYYKNLYSIRKSNSDSLEYMRLDPYNTYEGRYLYFVKSASFDSLDAILAFYKTKLNGLREDYGALFNYSTESYGVANPYLSSADELKYDNPTATLTITVYGDTREACTSKLDEIDKYIISIYNDIKTDIVGHELKRITESCYKIQDSTILDMQRVNIDALNSLNNSINTIYNNLSEEAKAFVTHINNHSGLDWGEIITSSPESGVMDVLSDKNVEDIDYNNTLEPKVSAKWIALGALIGFALTIIILSIVYCYRNKVRYEDDIESFFGVPCIGITKVGAKRRIGLDKCIDRARYKNINIFCGENAVAMIAANIAVCAYDNNVKTLWATSTSFNESSILFAEKISGILKSKGINMTVGHSLYSSAIEIEKMASYDSVVLFESVSKSNCLNIKKAIRSGSDRGINTLGIVIVA